MVNEYVIIKTLGKGSYGKVKLCINVAENEFYAIKICHKVSDRNSEREIERVSFSFKGLLSRRRIAGKSTALHDVLREIAILKKSRHKNVVRVRTVHSLSAPLHRIIYLNLHLHLCLLLKASNFISLS